jgi:tetratricopeptide (TPR) repeat protein
VLLVGDGMEEQGDFVRHSASFQIRDMNQLITVLKTLEGSKRLLGMQAKPEESFLAGMVLEKVQGLTQEHAAGKAPRTGAYLTVLGPILQLTNINRQRLELVVDEFRQLAPGLLGETHWQKSPPNFAELLGDGYFYPLSAADEAAATSRMVEMFGNYLEEDWIHQPRRSLGNVPPIDAAGHGVLRKKLRGIILFVVSCAGKLGENYDFDRLRRKLGLLDGAAAAPAQGPDISALGAAELAELNAETLTDEQLEQAFQGALKLDARELAGKFARLLLQRAPTAEKPDRYPMVNHLVQAALHEGDTNGALAALTEGEKLDAEHNESKRANDYGLRRGQIHAKRGEIDQAMAAFEQVFARSPAEVRYRGSAAEAMLAAKQPAKALQFAEEGLKKSREQNNRDSEQYFLELAAAARKQGA